MKKPKTRLIALWLITALLMALLLQSQSMALQKSKKIDVNKGIVLKMENTKKQNYGILTVKGKCSCKNYSDYNNHKRNWLNYCPTCKRKNTLVYDWHHSRPEGMIRCRKCDADFCIVHGQDHKHGSDKCLLSAI